MMHLNGFRLNSFRKVHCVCKSGASMKNSCFGKWTRNVQVKILLPYVQQVRCISTGNYTRKDIILETEKDSLSEVYRGSISRFIYRVKAFSLMTSVFGVATQPIVLNNALKSETSTALIIGAFSFIGFFTFVTPILLHMLTKRYILRLDYCPKTNEYYASTYSFFLRNNVDKFKVDDIFIPDIPGMLTTFEVNKRPFFVDKESFIDLEHYKKIMGYDKPLDFKLGNPKTIKKE